MMKKPVSPGTANSSRPMRGTSLRDLASQMLAWSDSGMSRAEFLKSVSSGIAELCNCDIIKIVYGDSECRFRCEYGPSSSRAFRIKEESHPTDKSDCSQWVSGDNAILERLCHDILNRHFDSKTSCISSNGSFWSADLKTTPIVGTDYSGTGAELGISISEGCQSMALIPLILGTDRSGLLEIESTTRNLFAENSIEFYESIAQSVGFAIANRRLQVELRERVKELICLYGIAKLGSGHELPLSQVLQGTVELLPAGWMYPEACCARIVFDGLDYKTGNFRMPVQKIEANILVDGHKRGLVEVGYMWEKSLLDEGPFLSEERNLIEAIAHEVSTIIEHRQADDEKVALQEQLRHAERLATIGQLGAGLAHELNEPLGNILGFAQLIGKDQALSEQTCKDLDKIVAASLHAREVITKLLVFARETTPSRSTVNLNLLVQDGLYFLQSRCSKGDIEVIRKLSSGLPGIVVDSSQMLQVLTNLVVNAIQAMPDGGKLTIGTSFDDNHVNVYVADTGTGMPENVRARIFDPFFTTKEIGEGTGLGLSVVHGIVAAHQGLIEVETVVGQGTSFTVILPRHTSSEGVNTNE